VLKLGGKGFYTNYVAENDLFSSNIWRTNHVLRCRRGATEIQRAKFTYIPSPEQLRQLSKKELHSKFLKRVKYTAVFLVDQITFIFNGGHTSPPKGTYMGKNESRINLPRDYSIGRVAFGLHHYR
jgi:hypothetical protein